MESLWGLSGKICPRESQRLIRLFWRRRLKGKSDDPREVPWAIFLENPWGHFTGFRLSDLNSEEYEAQTYSRVNTEHIPVLLQWSLTMLNPHFTWVIQKSDQSCCLQNKVQAFCADSSFDQSSFAPPAALTRVLFPHRLFVPHPILSRQQWHNWGSFVQLDSTVPLVLRNASNSKQCYTVIKHLSLLVITFESLPNTIKNIGLTSPFKTSNSGRQIKLIYTAMNVVHIGLFVKTESANSVSDLLCPSVLCRLSCLPLQNTHFPVDWRLLVVERIPNIAMCPHSFIF